MRALKLGAAPPKESWSPKFVRKKRAERTDKVGRKNTMVMAYFPTVKGEWRMEALRNYFHTDFALILDARSEVRKWTAVSDAWNIPDGKKGFEFTPDFWVEERSGSYPVRLFRDEPSRESRVREKYTAAREFFRARGQQLVTMTAVELAAHPLLPAAQELFVNRVRDWDPRLPNNLAERWGTRCPTTLALIHKDMGGRQDDWHQLLSLIAYGFVEIDLDFGLRPETPVTQCREEGFRHVG